MNESLRGMLEQEAEQENASDSSAARAQFATFYDKYGAAVSVFKAPASSDAIIVSTRHTTGTDVPSHTPAPLIYDTDPHLTTHTSHATRTAHSTASLHLFLTSDIAPGPVPWRLGAGSWDLLLPQSTQT